MDKISSTLVRTRKPHVCWACRVRYPSGSLMTVEKYVSPEGFWRNYSCATCEQILSVCAKREDFSDPWDRSWDEGFVRDLCHDNGLRTSEQLHQFLLNKYRKE